MVDLIPDDNRVIAFGSTAVGAGGDLVFTAPIRPVDVATGKVSGSPREQAAAAYRNLEYVLARAGVTLNDVVRVRLWISSVDVVDDVNAASLDVFPDRASRPVVSHIVAEHADGVTHVLIEALAVRSGQRASVYRRDTADGPWPGGCVKGVTLCAGSFAGANGLAPDGEEVSAADQAARAFAQLDDVLEQAECDHRSVGHIFVWYRDHSFREIVNGPFLERYPHPGDRPVRHSVIRTLPPGVGIQIEAIATTGERRFNYSIPGAWHAGIQRVPNSLPFGTKIGPVLYSAATYGQTTDGGSSSGDIDEQCDLAFRHTRALLSAAGMNLDHVTHVYAWISDGAHAARLDRAWAHHFGASNPGPVRHDIVASLPGLDAGPFLVQLEITAVSA